MALVDTQNPGAGILVDAKAIGRPVGDTSSSAVFLTDLPKNFQGGEEALHFALGELFGQYGKIKKIELYMEKGILETENFKGEALVVYHKSKHTGSHDKGDPVYEACTDMDGRVRVLGHRNWRVRCEPAVWQKEGFDVKDRAKKSPCVELTNLWEYSPNTPLAWFFEIQEVIRQHCSEHVQQPFVKVEPSDGSATIWCKGAQDCMKLASIMQKSYFMGRKVVASLCRKERPFVEQLPRLPIGELTMKLPTELTMKPKVEASVVEEQAAEPVVNENRSSIGPSLDPATAPPAFLLREGCIVQLKDLVAKPENNGMKATVVSWMPDLQKYQVRLEDGKFVRIKPENLETVQEPIKSIPRSLAEPDEEETDEEAAAQAMAEEMAKGNVPHGPQLMSDDTINIDGFTPTVCVDPALLPKKEEPAPQEPVKRRDRSRSRERRQQERLAAVQARLEADKGPRPSWIVTAPAETPVTAAAGTNGQGGAPTKEPAESREELLKFPVSKLKELLKEYGKSARGCIEKKDFVDRLKPAPK